MGDSYYNLENYEKAMQCFDKCMKLDPKDVDAIIKKGDCLKKL